LRWLLRNQATQQTTTSTQANWMTIKAMTGLTKRRKDFIAPVYHPSAPRTREKIHRLPRLLQNYYNLPKALLLG